MYLRLVKIAIYGKLSSYPYMGLEMFYVLCSRGGDAPFAVYNLKRAIIYSSFLYAIPSIPTRSRNSELCFLHRNFILSLIAAPQNLSTCIRIRRSRHPLLQVLHLPSRLWSLQKAPGLNSPTRRLRRGPRAANSCGW